MYAKLENQQLIKAPDYLIIGNNKVWNASEADHISKGWYPVVYTDEPTVEEGYYAEYSWEQDGETIVQTWEIKELPDEVSAEEIAQAISEVLDDTE